MLAGLCLTMKSGLFGHEDCQRPSVADRHLDASVIKQKISEPLGRLREGDFLDALVVLHNRELD